MDPDSMLTRPNGLSCGRDCQSAYRRRIDFERAGDIGQRLARLKPAKDFCALIMVQLPGLPSCTPRSLARLRPSAHLALMSDRSNSARPRPPRPRPGFYPPLEMRDGAAINTRDRRTDGSARACTDAQLAA